MFNLFLSPKNKLEKCLQKFINFIFRVVFRIFRSLIKTETQVISGDFFRLVSDSEFPNINKKNKIIFSKLDNLEKILEKKIKQKNWIFHNSDLSFGIKEYKKIIKLKPKTCFSTNMIIEKKNFYNIPIGLENLKYNKFYLGNKSLIKNNISSAKKQASIIYGFSMTHKERFKYISVLKKNKLCLHTYGWNNFIYRKILSRYMFVFCPRGNGYDTHRIWEAFHLKTVPILIKDKFNSFYEKNDFPVIMIDEIDDINFFSTKKLIELYDSLKIKFYNKKIYPKYWKNFIKNIIK
jgi:hypothetical protein